MSIIKRLEDGSVIGFPDDADPNSIAQKVKEKNLEISLLKDQIKKRSRPDYNPSETLEEDAIGTKEASAGCRSRGCRAGYS